MKILIVDDESSIADMTQKTLENSGYEARVAYHGQHALHVIIDEKFMPDILLTDVRMGTLDGVGLVNQLRERKACPEMVIFMSSHTGMHTHEELQALTPHFIQKPFRIKNLPEMLARILAPSVPAHQAA
jgi:DNA-binding response OmpR family regulator